MKQPKPRFTFAWVGALLSRRGSVQPDTGSSADERSAGGPGLSTSQAPGASQMSGMCDTGAAESGLSGRASRSGSTPGRVDTGDDAALGPTSRRDRRRRAVDRLLALSVFILFIGMVALFSALKPGHFPTAANTKAILSSAATIAVLGCGLTFVLVNNEFDLSFDNNTTLAGAVAVVAMASLHLGTALGIALGILAGAAVGLVNGYLVAYLRAPAFVATLAVGSMALGAARAITKDQTIYNNIPSAYANFADSAPLGIPMTIWLSVGLVVITWIGLEFTVLGRRAYAVGGNATAARLAGIRTARIRLISFGVLGGCAGLAGVIITSQAASFFPDLGTGVLLPAYAAAFLGSSATTAKQFRSWSTYFGVVFISALETGLQMVQLPPWTLDFFQGLVLAVAVVIAARRRG